MDTKLRLKQKLILVDADGVLLDWIYAFDQWMKRHGYELKDPNGYSVAIRYATEDGKRLAKMFNESAWIRKLPPHKDAIHYVKKLHQEHGYVFHVISSLSDDEYSQHLRTKNLRELFGDTVFEKYVYLDTGADKNDALEFYRDTGCFWVEDKPENADLGYEMGLTPLLMEHDHNADHVSDNVWRVQNWREVYEIITQS
jgi:uncharacterized HAD superfamily protein